MSDVTIHVIGPYPRHILFLNINNSENLNYTTSYPCQL
jgi:hypothetical protein